jgi:hypothetical protein
VHSRRIPTAAFTGRTQVLANWTSVFAGVADFRAELLAQCRVPEVTSGASSTGLTIRVSVAMEKSPLVANSESPVLAR